MGAMRRLLLPLALAAVLVPTALAGRAAKAVPLAARVLANGDLPGFAPPSKPQVYVRVEDWAAGFPKPAVEAARLRKLGFAGAAFEHLTPEKLQERDAVSSVIRFRTQAAARANMDYAIASASRAGVKVTRFAVPAIPGAAGLSSHRSDGAGYDVVFVDGPLFYDIGAYTPHAKQPPTAAQVLAAATKLYHRVHGHPVR
jgi:hypothetical protein